MWCLARKFLPDDPSVTEGIKAVGNRAFGAEDRPVLEAAQRMLDRTGFRHLNLTRG